MGIKWMATWISDYDNLSTLVLQKLQDVLWLWLRDHYSDFSIQKALTNYKEGWGLFESIDRNDFQTRFSPEKSGKRYNSDHDVKELCRQAMNSLFFNMGSIVEINNLGIYEKHLVNDSFLRVHMSSLLRQSLKSHYIPFNPEILQYMKSVKLQCSTISTKTIRELCKSSMIWQSASQGSYQGKLFEMIWEDILNIQIPEIQDVVQIIDKYGGSSQMKINHFITNVHSESGIYHNDVSIFFNDLLNLMMGEDDRHELTQHIQMMLKTQWPMEIRSEVINIVNMMVGTPELSVIHNLTSQIKGIVGEYIGCRFNQKEYIPEHKKKNIMEIIEGNTLCKLKYIPVLEKLTPDAFKFTPDYSDKRVYLEVYEMGWVANTHMKYERDKAKWVYNMSKCHGIPCEVAGDTDFRFTLKLEDPTILSNEEMEPIATRYGMQDIVAAVQLFHKHTRSYAGLDLDSGMNYIINDQQLQGVRTQRDRLFIPPEDKIELLVHQINSEVRSSIPDFDVNHYFKHSGKSNDNVERREEFLKFITKNIHLISSEGSKWQATTKDKKREIFTHIAQDFLSARTIEELMSRGRFFHHKNTPFQIKEEHHPDTNPIQKRLEEHSHFLSHMSSKEQKKKKYMFSRTFQKLIGYSWYVLPNGQYGHRKNRHDKMFEKPIVDCFSRDSAGKIFLTLKEKEVKNWHQVLSESKDTCNECKSLYGRTVKDKKSLWHITLAKLQNSNDQLIYDDSSREDIVQSSFLNKSEDESDGEESGSLIDPVDDSDFYQEYSDSDDDLNENQDVNNKKSDETFPCDDLDGYLEMLHSQVISSKDQNIKGPVVDVCQCPYPQDDQWKILQPSKGFSESYLMDMICMCGARHNIRIDIPLISMIVSQMMDKVRPNWHAGHVEIIDAWSNYLKNKQKFIIKSIVRQEYLNRNIQVKVQVNKPRKKTRQEDDVIILDDDASPEDVHVVQNILQPLYIIVLERFIENLMECSEMSLLDSQNNEVIKHYCKSKWDYWLSCTPDDISREVLNEIVDKFLNIEQNCTALMSAECSLDIIKTKSDAFKMSDCKGCVTYTPYIGFVHTDNANLSQESVRCIQLNGEFQYVNHRILRQWDAIPRFLISNHIIQEQVNMSAHHDKFGKEYEYCGLMHQFMMSNSRRMNVIVQNLRYLSMVRWSKFYCKSFKKKMEMKVIKWDEFGLGVEVLRFSRDLLYSDVIQNLFEQSNQKSHFKNYNAIIHQFYKVHFFEKSIPGVNQEMKKVYKKFLKPKLQDESLMQKILNDEKVWNPKCTTVQTVNKVIETFYSDKSESEKAELHAKALQLCHSAIDGHVSDDILFYQIQTVRSMDDDNSIPLWSRKLIDDLFELYDQLPNDKYSDDVDKHKPFVELAKTSSTVDNFKVSLPFHRVLSSYDTCQKIQQAFKENDKSILQESYWEPSKMQGDYKLSSTFYQMCQKMMNRKSIILKGDLPDTWNEQMEEFLEQIRHCTTLATDILNPNHISLLSDLLNFMADCAKWLDTDVFSQMVKLNIMRSRRDNQFKIEEEDDDVQFRNTLRGFNILLPDMEQFDLMFSVFCALSYGNNDLECMDIINACKSGNITDLPHLTVLAAHVITQQLANFKDVIELCNKVRVGNVNKLRNTIFQKKSVYRNTRMITTELIYTLSQRMKGSQYLTSVDAVEKLFLNDHPIFFGMSRKEQYGGERELTISDTEGKIVLKMLEDMFRHISKSCTNSCLNNPQNEEHHKSFTRRAQIGDKMMMVEKGLDFTPSQEVCHEDCNNLLNKDENDDLDDKNSSISKPKMGDQMSYDEDEFQSLWFDDIDMNSLTEKDDENEVNKKDGKDRKSEKCRSNIPDGKTEDKNIEDIQKKIGNDDADDVTRTIVQNKNGKGNGEIEISEEKKKEEKAETEKKQHCAPSEYHFTEWYFSSEDHSAWGPCHHSLSFQKLMSNITLPKHIHKTINYGILRHQKKLNEIPASIIEGVLSKVRHAYPILDHLSLKLIDDAEMFRCLNEEELYVWNLLKKDLLCSHHRFDMGQGMLHSASDVYGSFCSNVSMKVAELVLKKLYPGFKMCWIDMNTSDDSNCMFRFLFPYGPGDNVSALRDKMLRDITNIKDFVQKCLNEHMSPKSVVSDQISEFKSSFMFGGCESRVLVKFCSSQLMLGKDYMPHHFWESAYSLSQQCLANGGSMISVYLLCASKFRHLDRAYHFSHCSPFLKEVRTLLPPAAAGFPIFTSTQLYFGCIHSIIMKACEKLTHKIMEEIKQKKIQVKVGQSIDTGQDNLRTIQISLIPEDSLILKMPLHLFHQNLPYDTPISKLLLTYFTFQHLKPQIEMDNPGIFKPLPISSPKSIITKSSFKIMEHSEMNQIMKRIKTNPDEYMKYLIHNEFLENSPETAEYRSIQALKSSILHSFKNAKHGQVYQKAYHISKGNFCHRTDRMVSMKTTLINSGAIITRLIDPRRLMSIMHPNSISICDQFDHENLIFEDRSQVVPRHTDKLHTHEVRPVETDDLKWSNNPLAIYASLYHPNIFSIIPSDKLTLSSMVSDVIEFKKHPELHDLDNLLDTMRCSKPNIIEGCYRFPATSNMFHDAEHIARSTQLHYADINVSYRVRVPEEIDSHTDQDHLTKLITMCTIVANNPENELVKKKIIREYLTSPDYETDLGYLTLNKCRPGRIGDFCNCLLKFCNLSEPVSGFKRKMQGGTNVIHEDIPGGYCTTISIEAVTWQMVKLNDKDPEILCDTNNPETWKSQIDLICKTLNQSFNVEQIRVDKSIRKKAVPVTFTESDNCSIQLTPNGFWVDSSRGMKSADSVWKLVGKLPQIYLNRLTQIGQMHKEDYKYEPPDTPDESYYQFMKSYDVPEKTYVPFPIKIDIQSLWRLVKSGQLTLLTHGQHARNEFKFDMELLNIVYDLTHDDSVNRIHRRSFIKGMSTSKKISRMMRLLFQEILEGDSEVNNKMVCFPIVQKYFEVQCMNKDDNLSSVKFLSCMIEAIKYAENMNDLKSLKFWMDKLVDIVKVTGVMPALCIGSSRIMKISVGKISDLNLHVTTKNYPQPDQKMKKKRMKRTSNRKTYRKKHGSYPECEDGSSSDEDPDKPEEPLDQKEEYPEEVIDSKGRIVHFPEESGGYIKDTLQSVIDISEGRVRVTQKSKFQWLYFGCMPGTNLKKMQLECISMCGSTGAKILKGQIRVSDMNYVSKLVDIVSGNEAQDQKDVDAFNDSCEEFKIIYVAAIQNTVLDRATMIYDK
ncbi:RNA-dependent RNA polymerase [Hubei myriapoda virus 5]|uniref:RNA-directed RNA polymerase L n=1 Tax=Hubei myriapoda virus 5 TaxID=1922934 RepID=A0A1L3KPM8_9VIRU|nr:RNA-dependent RNA polymerase [Hubei myriapoda virus 5]APG79247.1 RNA-dependent RNA polymerase [Hubei myriapoda virus 5]APG79329.1 RNA-dependent RNA polymerase [Hubei myriapoda virus 5]